MLAIAEPKARLKLVWIRSRRAARAAARVSGSSTSSAITTPTNGLREADRGDAGLDGRRLDLGQADHGDQGHQQQGQADQRGPPVGGSACSSLGHHLAVGGDRQEVVAVPDGLGRPRRCRRAPARRRRRRRAVAAENSGPGWLVVKFGSTRHSVARVARVASARAGALGVEPTGC